MQTTKSRPAKKMPAKANQKRPSPQPAKPKSKAPSAAQDPVKDASQLPPDPAGFGVSVLDLIQAQGAPQPLSPGAPPDLVMAGSSAAAADERGAQAVRDRAAPASKRKTAAAPKREVKAPAGSTQDPQQFLEGFGAPELAQLLKGMCEPIAKRWPLWEPSELELQMFAQELWKCAEDLLPKFITSSPYGGLITVVTLYLTPRLFMQALLQRDLQRQAAQAVQAQKPVEVPPAPTVERPAGDPRLTDPSIIGRVEAKQ